MLLEVMFFFKVLVRPICPGATLSPYILRFVTITLSGNSNVTIFDIC